MPEINTRLDLGRIRTATTRIAPEFLHSPQEPCESLGTALGCEIILKDETNNPIGCFKGRGTETVMTRLADRNFKHRVVCASAGNLGQALAYSGKSRGIPVTIFVGSSANHLKVDRISELGAEVRVVGEDIEDARIAAREYSANHNAYLVEDSLDLDTCEGAGTIGLELATLSEPIDTVLLNLGGGAMATGIGHVVKALMPESEVITVQPAGAPAMTLSWRSKKIIETESIDTIADGVAGRFPIPEVLEDLLQLTDDAILVKEDSIKTGMRLLHDHAKLTVEPSAALGIAAILENKSRFAGKRIATIICGRNVNPDDFNTWTASA